MMITRQILRKASLGFTLLELLIVMTIIGVLAGLVFAVGPSILRQTRKQSVRGEMQVLNVAISEYYSEYGRYPVAISAVDAAIEESYLENNSTTKAPGVDVVIGGDEENSNLENMVNVLLAEPVGWNEEHLMNPKRIAFLTPRSAKAGPTGPRDGLGPDGKLYDRWGNEFRIFLDTNYDEKLSGPGVPDFDYIDVEIKNRDGAFTTSIMILSVGEDGELGNKKRAMKGDDGTGGRSYKGSDDVASWL